MPKLENYFHYRNLDVSTIKELARRWSPAVYKGVVKKGSHKALDDIVESIEELKHYRDTFSAAWKKLTDKTTVLIYFFKITLANFASAWFNTRFLGQIAQSVEQRIENPCVGGSIPPLATKFKAQTVKLTFGLFLALRVALRF